MAKKKLNIKPKLPKAGGGMLKKTLTNNQTLPRNTMFKDNRSFFEKTKDNIEDGYREQSTNFLDRYFPQQDFESSGGHNDYVDAIRHAGSSMYMTSGQGEWLAPLKVPYTNVMGIAHEIEGLSNYLSNPKSK